MMELCCVYELLVQVKAGVPERLMELALVSVAHFEPVEIQVLIEGTYPMLSFNLPRVKDTAFRDALTCARNRSALSWQAACGVWLRACRGPFDTAVACLLTCSQLWMIQPYFLLHMHLPACSSKEHELAVTVQRPMDSNLGRLATPLAGSKAFTAVPRGSVGPGSYAGTVVTAVTAGGRPGSGAKSGMSGVSGVSGAKSKASLASAISAGIVLAKDKLAQVGVVNLRAY
jgi:hypothetical protein